MSKTTILLIEDCRFMSLASERILAKAGYSVVTARDGEEALRVARIEVPDLVLLDMLLPKLGGQQVLHALKQDPITTHIPVIVLSSLPQKNEAKLKREGAAAYFEKSTWILAKGPNSLVEAVEGVLRASEDRRRQAEIPVASANPTAT